MQRSRDAEDYKEVVVSCWTGREIFCFSGEAAQDWSTDYCRVPRIAVTDYCSQTR